MSSKISSALKSLILGIEKDLKERLDGDEYAKYIVEVYFERFHDKNREE